MHQDQREYEAAIVAYRKSIETHPGNAESHNALGVVYAALGRNQQAITEFLAALAIAPASAHVHNNLGYAYLLAGRNEDAVAALRKGSRLSPGNARLVANLRAAERRLAAASAKPVLPAPREVGAKPRAESPAPDPSVPQLVSVAPNVFELHQAQAPVAVPVLAVAAAAAEPAIHAPVYLGASTVSALKLEIANGNGVPGLAKRTATLLGQKGFVSFRLTNQVPYVQKVTEIQYRAGEEAEAQRLNALLATPAKLVLATRLNRAVGVRLVLGHDSSRQLVLKDTDGALASDTPEQPGPRG
jgi:tetratricopeptide (TPR) repeat protein